MKDLWILEGRESSGKRWTIDINNYPFVIGRGKGCNLTLTSSNVSREHATITMSEDELFIEDCKSTNGTLLNGGKLSEPKRFYENDKLNICDFEFKLIKDRDEDEEGTIITHNTSPIEAFGKKFNLTPRECELLGYLAKGLSTKDIAASMFISPGTAKNHILNLLKKTGTHKRLELIRAFEEES